MSNLHINLRLERKPKIGPSPRGQVVNPLPQTPQAKSVSKPENTPADYPECSM